MMNADDLRAMPTKPWMTGGVQPKLHEYLSQKLSKDDGSRLKAIGNVVCPPMAHFACQILAGMW